MAPSLFALLIFQCILGFWEIYAEARERREKGKSSYDFRETISNVSVFSLNVFRVLLVIPAFYLYNQLLLLSGAWHFNWDKSALFTWAVALLAADLAYYIFHVLSHRWNLLWGGHLVHHQPEHWNLSISGRDSIWGRAIICFMGLPFALTGLPALNFFFAVFLGNAYMGWLHTRLPIKLGPLEYVLNTPAHHKIHHYKDIVRLGGTKNLGGVFIFWDRIFGTFWEEKDEQKWEYGIPDPTVQEPLRAQVFFYRHLFKLFFKIPAKDRVKLLFSHYLPEPVPAELGSALDPKRTYSYFDWCICALLLILVYQSASALSLGMSYRLVEGTFDGALLARVVVACAATFIGILQVSQILYGSGRTSLWAKASPFLSIAVVGVAFVFLAQTPAVDLKRSILDFILGSRAYLVFGALIALR